MKALLLVDLQNDFLPGGALGVQGGDNILPFIHRILKVKFDKILASLDWHPFDHCSFAEVHGKRPGEEIDLSGMKQILWPRHCVQHTHGADFTQAISKETVEKFFHKGVDKSIDSYSAFFDNGHRRATGLDGYLKENQIADLYLAGLTTEYCVKYSALDALSLGYNVFVIEDACCGVNLRPQDAARALTLMKERGTHIIQTGELDQF